jgi:hypothetical protein
MAGKSSRALSLPTVFPLLSRLRISSLCTVGRSILGAATHLKGCEGSDLT